MSAYDVTLASAGRSLAKQATIIDGIVTRVDDPPWPRLMKFAEVWIAGPDDLLAVLFAAASDDPAPCVVRAAPLGPTGRRAIRDHPERGPAGLKPADRAWAGLDFDSIPADGIDPLREPEKAVGKIRVCLPPEHHDTTVVWQLTASAGKKLDKLHLRLWFLYDKPLHGRQLETWCKPAISAGWLDPCTLRNPVLPHFIAVKALGNSPDPCPQRWGIIRGERDLVPVPDHALVMPGNAGKPYRGRTTAGGNLDELRARYGPRLRDRQREAVAAIRDAIEATRAATKGARHPTYMRSAATIVGLCR